MDVETAVYLWNLHRRNTRRRNRRRNNWVNPILLSRPNESQYITFYTKLKTYEPKFFKLF